MMFLEPEELRVLTGKAQKVKQVEQLRRMGLPFYVNAAGHPVVARAVIEGASRQEQSAAIVKPWRPAVLGT
jgi:hypothetical protein